MSYYSIVEYTSTGAVKVFAIPFTYIQTSDIKVYLDGLLQSSSAYTFPTSASIDITVQPAAGVVVKIQRSTTLTARLVDFQNAAVITESDLDLNSQQVFNIMQETVDLNSDSFITAQMIADAQAAEAAAAAQVALAAAQVALAEDQVDLAAAQVTLATAQQELAQLWAEEAENVQVETGKYSALHWAAKAQAWAAGALQAVATGVVVDFVGAVVPVGYLLCDGAAVSRTTYADLFAAIADAWGVGDGTTTFNLPDLRDAFTIGASATKALASEGGAEDVTLTTAHLPVHTHDITVGSGGAHTHYIRAKSGTGFESVAPENVSGRYQETSSAVVSGGAHVHTATAGISTGGDTPVPTLPPYAAVKKIIKT